MSDVERQMTVTVVHPQQQPTLLGLHQEWVAGADPDTGTKFSLTCGAGLGSQYLQLNVTLPTGQHVQEYIDIAAVVQEWVEDLIEAANNGGVVK